MIRSDLLSAGLTAAVAALCLTACDVGRTPDAPSAESVRPVTPPPEEPQLETSGSTQPRESRPADALVDSIGVNTHLHYLDTSYAHFDEIVRPRLRELGVRHIRDGVVADEKIRVLGREGIRLMPLAHPDQWESLTELSSFLAGLEGPNETDLFDFSYKGASFPEGTRAFMRDFHALAKETPGLRALPLLAPSTGRPEGGNVLGPVPCDAGNLHSYAGGRPPESPDILDRFASPARRVAGEGKAFYATECGYHTLAKGFENWAQPGVSEQAAAKYLTRLLLNNFREGIRRSYVYELLDTVSSTNPALDGKGSESRYGLVRADGTPKPSFLAIRNLIGLLADPGADPLPASLDYKLGNAESIESLLLHKQDGSFYLVLWQSAVSFDLATEKDAVVPDREVTVSLSNAAAEIAIYRPVESDLPVASQRDVREITVPVPDHPAVVRIVPKPKAPDLPDLVLKEFEFVEPPQPGGPLEFRAVVANEGSAEVPVGTVIGVTAYEEGEKSGPATARKMGTYGTHEGGLAPGASVEIRPSGPKWTPGADVTRIAVVVDDVDRIEESNEQNNSRETVRTNAP